MGNLIEIRLKLRRENKNKSYMVLIKKICGAGLFSKKKCSHITIGVVFKKLFGYHYMETFFIQL